MGRRDGEENERKGGVEGGEVKRGGRGIEWVRREGERGGEKG